MMYWRYLLVGALVIALVVSGSMPPSASADTTAARRVLHRSQDLLTGTPTGFIATQP